MAQLFFEDLNLDYPTGVAYKNVHLKKQLISSLANTGNATIAELCKVFGLSTPKVTALLQELTADGLVQDYGKVDSTGGRKPNVYGLAPDAGFFMGIDVKQNYLNIGLTNFQKELVEIHEKCPYQLRNDQASLDELCRLIKAFVEGLTIPKEKILGIGINLSGRVNYATGYSYSFFHFHEDPLSKILEAQLGIRVILENDSRAMAYGEFCNGVVKDEKDVLYLNLDYGIGMGVMIDGRLYYGKSGYSGEFGHIPLFDNDIICQCGKKGCLETEAAGWALIRLFRQKLSEGYSSILISRRKMAPGDITLGDIIDAANDDDVLAIELIAEIGEKIGRGVALLINIFNPELVILGGSLAQTEDYIRLPIKSAINKYSLSLMNNDTQLKLSQLGNQAGLIGAGLIARNQLLH